MSSERKLIKEWERWYGQFIEDISDNPDQSPQERAGRIKRLEDNPEEWFKYYFPKYCTAEPAKFHKDATERLLSNTKWYEVRAWSRELAKSARSMFEVLFLALTKQSRNVLLVSSSQDNAIRLLMPFMISLEYNKRIIADYGEQRIEGRWTDSEFTAKCGCSFRALGAGQSPRGTRNEEIRPDVIIVDDIDTDEECRNPERIKTKWAWVEEALMGTLSVAGSRRILFNGNIIAKDCSIARAIERADHTDIINIRMVSFKKSDPQNDYKYGNSVWPAKNSEEDIDYTLSKISLIAAQKEYFNNPLSEGDTFKEVTFGDCPEISKFPFLVAYGDPATSNKDKKGASTKALVLAGILQGKTYILRCHLDNCTNATFTEWFYHVRDWVKERTQVYYYIENNSLQDPFFEQVFKPLFLKKGEKLGYISVAGDDRKKPDKFVRIEGNLEPLNRNGDLILNKKEKDNPNMQRLRDQFLAISPTLPAAADGVDAVEGAVWILRNKIIRHSEAIIPIPNQTNNHRY